MADFVLSCCSTADLTKEHFQQRDISYICFHYQLDGVDYPDDLGESMPFDKFYAAMANGADTRTSQVNISEFVDYFTPTSWNTRMSMVSSSFRTGIGA